MEEENETEELENEQSSVENQEQESSSTEGSNPDNPIQSAMRAKLMAQLAAYLGPIAFMIVKIILVILTIIVLFTLVIEMVLSAANFVYSTGDKINNLFRYGKLSSSEQVFVETLIDEYESYHNYKTPRDEFDLPIIMSTVNYGRLLDTSGFDESLEYVEEIFNEEETGFGKFIPANKVNSFYTVMNNELGHIYTLDPNQRMLLAHLVGFGIEVECRGLPIFEPDENLTDEEKEEKEEKEEEELENFFRSVLTGYGSFMQFFVNSAEATVKGSNSGIFNTYSLMPTNLVRGITLLSNLYSYKEAGYADDIYDFLDGEKLREEVQHEFQSPSEVVRRILSNSNIQTCGDWEVAIPYLVPYMDYELYEMYLEKYFLPRFQLDCPNCEYRDIPEDDPQRALVINRMINEIYHQRNFFIGYIPGIDENEFGGFIGDYDLSNLIGKGNFVLNPSGCGPGINLSNVMGNKYPGPGCVTSHYGPRSGGYHYGIDFGIRVGTEIYALDDGVVTHAACQNNGGCGAGYGLYVKMQHANGIETIYAHLDRLNVRVGDTVRAGDLIAASGNTGRSSGPHLHFEIIDNGRKVNPYQTLLNQARSNTENNDALLEE